MKQVTRRNALLVGLASLLTAGTSSVQAAPASVPVIWDGKKMFESFEKEATGISSKGPEGRPKAYVAFDTQCRDCWQLHRKLEPFLDKIEFIFCPISFMNIHSEPQATTILIDKNPLAKLEEHFAHFTDIEFRGIHYGRVEDLPVDVRDKVWTNTKLHRRAGCRAVPYGVFKNSKGNYLPFDERLTVEELKTLFEL
ncbi:MAG TPA: Tat pathway signal protein [Candidatus Aphodousia faecigallinarum]|uniref:Tat pathway signal protein n=1 Tax=Candidatus Aphodousia faecigallinarum TaxID=2840677 RepID=A0A9D1IG01_9BURK|nr:Tat pathway signal protein [Candidatus Aphodousia faecigallinarum]